MLKQYESFCLLLRCNQDNKPLILVDTESFEINSNAVWSEESQFNLNLYVCVKFFGMIVKYSAPFDECVSVKERLISD